MMASLCQRVGGDDYDATMPPVPTRSISDEPILAYRTERGTAWLGDAVETLQTHVADDSVDLIMTSPPFALQRPKEYGNESQESYKTWFMPFADEFWRVLKPTGSLVIDLGGAWEGGQPVKSLYAFELLVSFCRRPNRPFVLAQDFYWYNPARLPSPAQWVTIDRVRAKDSVNYVWWLSKTPKPKADNRRVLREYTGAMKRLIESGTYNRGRRPSGHVVREGLHRGPWWSDPAQPACDLEHRQRQGLPRELSRSRISGPIQRDSRPSCPTSSSTCLPRTTISSWIPFAGSNVTGAVAESLGRRWLSIDVDDDYLRGSLGRFEDLSAQDRRVLRGRRCRVTETEHSRDVSAARRSPGLGARGAAVRRACRPASR